MQGNTSPLFSKGRAHRDPYRQEERFSAKQEDGRRQKMLT